MADRTSTPRIAQIALASVLALAFLAFSTQLAMAAAVVQVNSPSDPGNQTEPAISGNRVVWQSSDGAIRTKNLATSIEETVYKDPTYSSLSPAISGERVVWNRNSTEIMMKDMGTGIVSTLTASIQSNPAGLAFLPSNPEIDGSTVVWEDHRYSPDPGDIFYKTIGGSEYAVVASPGTQNEPAVSGNNVVWADNNKGNYDIRIKKSGLFGDVTGVVAGNQEAPRISGNWVAWQDHRGSSNDIYVKDVSNLSNPQEIPPNATDPYTYLTANALLGDMSLSVADSSDIEPGDRLYISTTGASEWVTVASVPNPTTINLTVGLADAYPQFSPVVGLWDQSHPSIYASGVHYKVVWQDDRKDAGFPSPTHDVYMFDEATGQTTVVAGDPLTDQSRPQVYGDTVVWQDDRNGSYDIYMMAGPPVVSDDGAWTKSTDTLHATWTYPGTASEYRYAIGTGTGDEAARTSIKPWTNVGTSTGVTDTALSLTNGTTYYISVEANDGGWTDPGASDGIRVDTAPPTTPTWASVTPGNQTARLNWNASTDALSGMHPSAPYKVYRGDSQGGPYASIGTTTGPAYTDGGLTNGTVYWYKIGAFDLLGNEQRSVETSALPKSPAPTVADDGAWTKSTETLHASWSFVGSPDEYQYAVGTSPDGTQTRNWTSAGTSTEVTATGLSLTNGTPYYVSVKAYKGGNQLSEVGTSDGIRVDNVSPSVPAGLSTLWNQTSATINWNASTDALSGMHPSAPYTVYRSGSQGGSYASIGATSSPGFTDSSVTSGTTYWYKVTAQDVAGNESLQSQEVSATPGQTTVATVLTLVRSTSLLTYGSSLTLSGYLRSAPPTSTPIKTGASKIDVRRQLPGQSWQTIASLDTNASGFYSYAFKPASNAAYRATWGGEGSYAQSTSGALSVNVRSSLTLYRNLRSFRLGGRVKLYGTLSPTKRYKTVTIQYKSGGVWRKLTTDATDWYSKYLVYWKARYRGTYYIRAYYPADSLNAAGNSPYVKVVVY